MKEKNTATSFLKRILTNCGAQAKDYGSCVAARVPAVERDMCLNEFLKLKNCMQSVCLFLSGVQQVKIMFGKASSSQVTVGFSGSGTLSHVYIQHPPLRCSIPESRGLFYDDGNKLLLCPASDQVISWKTSPFNPQLAPTSDLISEGPILSIRCSLDAKILAIQRSNHEVQFLIRETGESFSQKCRFESESILGFFWTDCPICDVVFVKTSGLDLFSYDAELKSLHLVETKKLNISWYVYTHESRLVLLASGMQCNSFTGYQLSSAGIIRLPRFDMAMAKSEANNKPVLASEDIHIITVYGRIYCFQFDRVAMLLHSYRFYRDAVIQQGSLPMYSSKVAVSVVDNVVIVHQVDAKVVILYDLFSDSRAPISAPLPLLLRGLPRTNVITSQTSGKSAEGSQAKDISDAEAVIYGDNWNFLVPDLICDAANGFLWKIHLDLEAISASSSEVPLVLEFLQQRRLEANKAKHLCLAMVRTSILERRPVPMVARAIDILVTSYSNSVKTGSYFKGMKLERPSPSGSSNADISNIVSEGLINNVDPSGKSIKHEATTRVEDEYVNRSAFSTSDSEDNVGFGAQRIISDDLSSSYGKIDRKNLVRPEASGAQNNKSVSQPQFIVPGSNPLSADISEHQDSQITTAAITPDEMYTFVFAPVEEEMTGDASYLVAIIVEFLRSANLAKVKMHRNIYVLTVQLLARSERYAELGLFVINKVLEPSKEVALQLLESGRQNFQTRKLGLDMLRQLSLHHDYVLLLVRDGYYLEALRYGRKNKIDTVRPSLFLEAAYASSDSQHLAAVLRFLSDFIPGFRNSSDHSTYCRILAEMNSSIAV